MYVHLIFVTHKSMMTIPAPTVNTKVRIPILFKQSRLHCLHVCWHATCDIYKLDDGTHLQGLNTTQVRHYTHSDLSTLACRVCFFKHMMIMRQYLPWLWYDSCPLHAWSRSLSFFYCAGLWSAAKAVVSMFAKCAMPEEYPSHNFDEHCLEDTRLIWCLS